MVCPLPSKVGLDQKWLKSAVDTGMSLSSASGVFRATWLILFPLSSLALPGLKGSRVRLISSVTSAEPVFPVILSVCTCRLAVNQA